MSNDFFLYILRYPIFLIRAFPRDGGWIFVSYIYSWLNNFYIISLPLYSKRALFKGLIREGLRRKHSVDACPMIEWHRYVNRWSTFPGQSMEHFDKHFREPVSRNEITINAALLYPAATLRPA